MGTAPSRGWRPGRLPPPASNTRPWRGSYFLLLIPVPLLETRATVESWRAAAGRDHSSLDGGDNHHGQPDQDHHLHRAKFVLPINLYQLKNISRLMGLCCVVQGSLVLNWVFMYSDKCSWNGHCGSPTGLLSHGCVRCRGPQGWPPRSSWGPPSVFSWY